MEAAAAQYNKLLMFGFVRRFAQNTQVLKEYMDHGKLGDVYYTKAGLLRRCGSPGGWFADSAISGGGPLIDLGIHIIDLSVYLMGRPKPISVFGNTYNKIGSRSHINALIKFDNGASLFLKLVGL
jgi:predicted dehydrogenase